MDKPVDPKYDPSGRLECPCPSAEDLDRFVESLNETYAAAVATATADIEHPDGSVMDDILCPSCNSVWGFYTEDGIRICYFCGKAFRVEGHGFEEIFDTSVDNWAESMVGCH